MSNKQSGLIELFGTSRLAFAILLLLAACGRDTENSTLDNAENESSQTANSPAAANVTAVVAEPSKPELLAKYVGKHPSEAIDGTRFLDEPAVKAAVAANVPDPKVREFVFSFNGPDAPIVTKNGRILAWGCERHNCGYHNWSVAISPDGSTAEVCFYHNDNSPDGPATWYLPGDRTEKRAGNCPSD